MSTAPARLGWAGLVLALCLAGGALRVRGLDFLLPHQTALDGSVVVHQVDALREEDPELARSKRESKNFYFYPRLLAHTIVLLPDPVPPGETLDEHEHLARASADWLQARRVSTWLSLLIVPATFLVSRRFLARPWALCAAALVATSLLHARFGTMVRPHGLASSMIAWTVVGALFIRSRGGPLVFVLGALAGGLAVGSLHYGLAALPALLVGALLRRGGAWRAGRWRGTLAGVALGAAVAAAAVVALYPFEPEMLSVQETAQAEAALNLSGQPLKFQFHGLGFIALLRGLWSYDPLLLVLLVAGAVCAPGAIRRARGSDRGADALVVAAFALPYFVVVGLYDETWERFLLPLLPVIATLGAFALQRLHGRAPRAGLACTALVLAAATALQLQLGSVRAADDGHERVAAWVRGELGDRKLLLTTFRDVPVLHGKFATRQNRRRKWGSMWVRYQLAHDAEQRAQPRFDVYLPLFTPAELRARIGAAPAWFSELGMDYVLVEDVPEWSLSGNRVSNDAARLAFDLRQALRAEREPVWRSTPDRAGAWPSLAYQASQAATARRPYFWALLRARYEGPALEIYALDD